MGTNYNVHVDCCDKCGRSKDTFHIGKSSIGWQFHFKGDRPEIISVECWKKITSLPNTRIVDEYGEEMSFDDFWDFVYDKQKDENNMNSFRISRRIPRTKKEWEYLKKYASCLGSVDELEWIDPEGFSFTERDFS